MAPKNSARRNWIRITILSLLVLVLAACGGSEPEFLAPVEINVTLNADGETYRLTTRTSNVRTLLVEAGVEVNDTDEVSPPLFTPLTDNMTINVVRVTESIEFIEESLPFDRKTVRNEAMDVDEPPVIIQSGQPGLQEITVRIVYHDGLEVERAFTQVTLVEPPQDEIVMIGVGAGLGALDFSGNIAYMNGGQAVRACSGLNIGFSVTILLKTVTLSVRILIIYTGGCFTMMQIFSCE